MKTKEEAIQEYLKNKKEIDKLQLAQKKILKECESFYDHKVGEICKYIKKRSRRISGGGFPRSSVYERLPDEERYCVLTRITASIHAFEGIEYYISFYEEFRPIKKDGGVSGNSVYINKKDVIWTGEIHKDYK